MNAVSIAVLAVGVMSLIAWFIDGMLFAGFSLGLMVTSVLAAIFHRRELRKIQREGMKYLDYLLGDD